jgi:hypothetical protein
MSERRPLPMPAPTSVSQYTGNPARDILIDENRGLDAEIRSTTTQIIHALDHGATLSQPKQKRRMEALRAALARRGLLKHIERALEARDRDDDSEASA